MAFKFLPYICSALSCAGQNGLPAQDTLPPVTISAFRSEMVREQVPAMVTPIDIDDLQRRNLATDRAIERTAGVVVVDGEIQIRGASGWSYGAGSRAAVLLDGLLLLSGDALRPSWGLMPNEALQSIDLVKGPGSVNYGSSALSGVLSAKTIWPGETPFTRVNLVQGAYSYPQTESASYWDSPLMESSANVLHMRRINNWDFVFSANGRAADGYLGPMPDSLGQFENCYNPFTVDKYDASKSGRARLAFRHHFPKTEGLIVGGSVLSRYISSVSTLLWANDTTGLYQPYAGATTPGEQFFLMSDAFADYRTSPQFKHQFKYRWLHVDNGFDNNQDSYTNNHFFDYALHWKTDSIGIKGGKIIPGVYLANTNSKGSLYIADDTTGWNSLSNMAVFLHIEKLFWEKLRLSGGMRNEVYVLNGELETTTVSRLGLNYEVNDHCWLRVNYGEGFRFPTIAERFTRTAAGDFFIHPNPSLVPEKSKSAELGAILKWNTGPVHFDLDLAAFHQRFSNYIEYNFGHWKANPDNPLALENFGFKPLNTGRARINGLEAVLRSDYTHNGPKLSLLLSFSHTQPIALDPNFNYVSEPGILLPNVNYQSTSSDTSGNILKYRMRTTGRVQLDVQHKKWDLFLTGRYNSRMNNIDVIFENLDIPGQLPTGITRWRNAHTSDDILFDAGLSRKFGSHWTVGLLVNNILNYEYMSRPLQIESGRFVMLRLTYERGKG